MEEHQQLVQIITDIWDATCQDAVLSSNEVVLRNAQFLLHRSTLLHLVSKITWLRNSLSTVYQQLVRLKQSMHYADDDDGLHRHPNQYVVEKHLSHIRGLVDDLLNHNLLAQGPALSFDCPDAADFWCTSMSNRFVVPDAIFRAGMSELWWRLC